MSQLLREIPRDKPTPINEDLDLEIFEDEVEVKKEDPDLIVD